MKDKIKTWLENHETIYGVGLLCVSLCMLSFGGAYFGASRIQQPNNVVNLNIYGDEAVKKLYGE